MKQSFKQWWNTECKFCRQTRLILVWLILMFAADYFWFHLVF